MGAFELPLVFFTVLSQWAVGIVIILTILEWVKPTYMKQLGTIKYSFLAYLLFPLCALGTFLSLLHLGQPLLGFKALLGISQSWLSVEISLYILLNLSMLFYSFIWWKKRDHHVLRKVWGTIVSIIGTVAILASAQVYYQIEFLSTWHHWTTFASFLLTGLLLGSLTVLFSMRYKDDDYKSNKSYSMVVWIMGITLGLMIIVVFSFGLILTETVVIVTGYISTAYVLYWIRTIFSIVIPIMLVLYIIKEKKLINSPFIFIAVTLALIGEFVGRMLFYYSGLI